MRLQQPPATTASAAASVSSVCSRRPRFIQQCRTRPERCCHSLEWHVPLGPTMGWDHAGTRLLSGQRAKLVQRTGGSVREGRGLPVKCTATLRTSRSWLELAPPPPPSLDSAQTHVEVRWSFCQSEISATAVARVALVGGSAFTPKAGSNENLPPRLPFGDARHRTLDLLSRSTRHIQNGRRKRK